MIAVSLFLLAYIFHFQSVTGPCTQMYIRVNVIYFVSGNIVFFGWQTDPNWKFAELEILFGLGGITY